MLRPLVLCSVNSQLKMLEFNSLERAFTVLTYFLSANDFQHIKNEKACQELDNASVNVSEILMSANEDKRKLDAIKKSLSHIDNNHKLELQQTLTQGLSYECMNSSIGKLFCEDNKYSKNLILIGRGQQPLSESLYKKLSNGISCDKTCLESDDDFFIGWNKFVSLNRERSYGLLLVYFDAAGLEYLYYIADVSGDDKKIKFSKITRSLLNYNVDELMYKKSFKKLSLKSWKIFLKLKE